MLQTDNLQRSGFLSIVLQTRLIYREWVVHGLDNVNVYAVHARHVSCWSAGGFDPCCMSTAFVPLYQHPFLDHFVCLIRCQRPSIGSTYY